MGYKNKKITPKKSKKGWVIVAVLVVLIGAVVAYLLLTSDKSSTSNQNQSTSTDFTPPAEEQIPTEITPDKSLYVENERYKIRYDEQSDTYTITLYAIINNPSQYETYKSELKEFKQEALRYLTDKGVNIEKAKIVYEPEEATNL